MMEILNYRGISRVSIIQVQVNVYSLKEWKETIYVEKQPLTVGAYNNKNRNIHIIAREELPEECTASWKQHLLHEIVHCLQHEKGEWRYLKPLGVKEVPIIDWLKKNYRPESWEVEAEAYWLMYRPELLDLQLERL